MVEWKGASQATSADKDVKDHKAESHMYLPSPAHADIWLDTPKTKKKWTKKQI